MEVNTNLRIHMWEINEHSSTSKHITLKLESCSNIVEDHLQLNSTVTNDKLS